MDLLCLSRAAMSSSLALIYVILAAIRSFIRGSAQLLPPVADRPIHDMKSILHTAAEMHSAGCIIAYPDDDLTDSASGRTLSYRELCDQALSNAALLSQTLNVNQV